MAMTAWSAKVSRSLICAGVKGRASMRRATQYANKFAFLTKGNEQESARAAEIRGLNIVLLVDVGNVKRAVLAYPAKCWRINTYLAVTAGTGPK